MHVRMKRVALTGYPITVVNIQDTFSMHYVIGNIHAVGAARASGAPWRASPPGSVCSRSGAGRWAALEEQFRRLGPAPTAPHSIHISDHVGLPSASHAKSWTLALYTASYQNVNSGTDSLLRTISCCASLIAAWRACGSSVVSTRVRTASSSVSPYWLFQPGVL